MNQLKVDITLNGGTFYKISSTEVLHFKQQD